MSGKCDLQKSTATYFDPHVMEAEMCLKKKMES